VDPAKVDIVSLLLHPVNTDTQWKQHAKEILDAKELEECTFQPKIITKYESSKISTLSHQRSDKCTELYMRAKPLKERKDKTRDDFDFEKGKDECTFHPNIGDSQRNMEVLYYGSQPGDSHMFATGDSVRGFATATQRLQKGRQEREKTRAMHARGIPGTVTDEAQMPPLHVKGNQNYKGVFSTFSHMPTPPPASTATLKAEGARQSQQSLRRLSQKSFVKGEAKKAEKENINSNHQKAQYKSVDNTKSSSNNRYSNNSKFSLFSNSFFRSEHQ